MPTLTLIRHSLPEIDHALPAARWHLSEEGRRRAAALADTLATEVPIDVIVSSPEPKARETAAILTERFGKPVSIAADLREHERSHVPLLPRAEFESRVADFFARPGDLVFGDETAEQAHLRFAHAIDEILTQFPAHNIAVVTHGTVMSLFLSRVLERDAFSIWKGLKLPGYATLSLPSLELLRGEL